MSCEFSAAMPLYQKFLRANLTTGDYEIGVVADDEKHELEKDTPKTIQDYFEWFSNSYLIHEADKVMFIEAARKIDAGGYIIYRRIIGGELKRVIMQIVPTVEYRPDNKDCIIYVCDIEHIYRNEYQKVLDKIGTTDHMTGLYNKVAYERDIRNYEKDLVGIAYIDLNGLKYANDNYGHKVGDELIVKLANLMVLAFPTSRCYHISGDEFIVLSYDCPVRKFLSDAIAFHKALWNTPDYPMASIGYCVGERDEISEVYADAERSMMDDKRMFYTKYPKYIRK